ncbi:MULTISPECIES: copper chaperone PCu(A)C [unclassified Acidovorax]|uniref:copper chaperone PCu(A)C n=1 Tax=unclassified Acidovorax TaxID=2684926 RepID=UPI0006829EB4|nr:copper chaperone PCu(A)C [Acidovorax sp. NO-1]
MKKLLHTAAIVSTVLAALATAPAGAQTATVKVEGAWARASVQGQTGTGAFMRLTAQDGARLVRAESPAAGVTEVHEMKMEGDVMKMRAVPALELPAGKTVELKPGGYHVMLLDLKAPLAKDSAVPITLVFQDAKGAESTLNLSVPVATMPPGGGAAAGHGHGHGHKQ